ncbi:electron transport complex subunit RsxE [Lacrimispora algidixylanolytica]|uniref:Ion-translocating oxidoreductase complex subunit E n=1 Tax=Lacrimispora algidixylanolytica TaxID=94868 RepID=A0A419SW06_9FIRM|nr:electron transport complex subunit E [Lacrimispora algidixylanolytica]RKD29416.1 electron transport complex subunit RsxE [Lacrimispora algidixylanolytica]
MKNQNMERLWNGIGKENPTFVLMLGMCPTLAVTTSLINGFAMGISTALVLMFSNILISLLRKIISDNIRIPAYIVIIATLVTTVQMLLQAYIPSLYTALGIYIPLIVVNCIILGRAESFASKNDVILSAFDGLGMGIGFTIALTLIGFVREILGAGSVLGTVVIPEKYHITAFVLAPGAFFALAVLTALQNKFKAPSATNGGSGSCSVGCGSCGELSGKKSLVAGNHGNKKE